jgi:hypothetical protein
MAAITGPNTWGCDPRAIPPVKLLVNPKVATLSKIGAGGAIATGAGAGNKSMFLDKTGDIAPYAPISFADLRVG